MTNETTALVRQLRAALDAVIRHRLAWDLATERGLTAGEFRNWNAMGGVHYDDPEHIGKEPLATIERAPTT